MAMGRRAIIFQIKAKRKLLRGREVRRKPVGRMIRVRVRVRVRVRELRGKERGNGWCFSW